MAGLSTARTMKNIGFALRVTSYILLVAGVSLVVLYLVQYMDALNKAISVAVSTGELGPLQSVLYNILYAPVILLAASAVLGYIGGSLEKKAEEARREFLEKLSGLVLMYQGISIQELSRRLREPPKAVEEALAEIAREGKLRIRVDSNGLIHAEPAAPQQPAAAPSPTVPVAASPVPPPAQPIAPESDQVRSAPVEEEGTQIMPQGGAAAAASEEQPQGDLEERLRRIEEAYRQGLISEETYRQLVEKLKKGEA